MSQCLFAHILGAFLAVSGVLLVMFVPMHSYYRTIKASPLASKSQPFDFAENFKRDQFLDMCAHDCTKYPLIFAKTCADLQNVQIHNRTKPLMLLYTGDKRDDNCSTADFPAPAGTTVAPAGKG